MTLAEQLKQEGRMEEIQQGMQTGERKASRKMARPMLKKGIPMADIIETTDVSTEQLPPLRH
ncbi:hypothetical protein [Salmonella enterica]|uniref:Transposase n=1 Tax=Salmonella enterica subsp. salamae serovar 42:f,g,t:-- TaxID=41518 RepID=A0A737LHW4_SALER|nr:hypothetical protein [Salmonella enterica]EHI7783673.1 hypothetical protein [Salmonella enterica]HAE8208521.1 hypothetical protein [Salmonella enterica subsp. salamae serovar 42:f,g,t:--]